MSLRAGVRRTSYRGGAADQRETTASVGGEVEYLMNRHISIFVNANYAQRYARIDLDDFKRTGAGVGSGSLAPPCRDAMGWGTAPAGRGGGGVTSRETIGGA